MSPYRRVRLLASVLVIIVAACSGGTVDPSPPPPPPAPPPPPPPAPIPVASVTLSRDTATVAIGATVQLTATLKDALGSVLTGRTVTWSSSAAGVATVSNTGLVTAVLDGTAQITALSEGKSSSATITVPQPPAAVTTIEVAPATRTLALHESVLLTATVKDQRGAVMTGKTVTWQSSNPALATVSAIGQVAAVGAGSVTISAGVDGKTGTSVLTIQDPGPQAATIPACTNCLEVVPGAVLLTQVGAQQQLVVFQVDANGQRSPVTATFQSSSAATVSVSAAGLVTAVAMGSSQVTAKAGTLTSAPVLVLVAQTAPGALLIGDAQVAGPIVPVDPAAPYQPGWKYTVRLRNVAPLVDQVLLSSGNAPIEGKVVSVTPVGTDLVDVVLSLLSINEMLPGFSTTQQVPLKNAPSAVPTQSLRQLVSRPQTAPGEVPFDLGPFKCIAKGGVGLSFPLTFNAVNFDLNPSLALDLVVVNGSLQRLVIQGAVSPTLSIDPVVNSAVQGSVECKVVWKTITLPIGGPLSLILGGQVPLGVGFGVEAKTTLGGLGFNLFLQSTVTVALGVDCTAACQVVSDVNQNADGFFKPILPNLANDIRVEIAASGFFWAGLTLGNPFITALQFETVDIKAGLKQSAALAGLRAQASDPAYASNIQLAAFFEAGTASEVKKLAGLLSIQLEELKFAPTPKVLSTTPAGTFTIQPSQVTAGNAQALGQTATFTVTLDPVTYLGIESVESVEILWKNPDGTFNPGRPGCTSIKPSGPGQKVFTCQTDFLTQHQGLQTFYAFVNAKIFGVSVPVRLEIGNDAKATVTVTSGTIAISPTSASLVPGQTQSFAATLTGFANQAVTWSATGGGITQAGLYTAGGQTGTFSVTVRSVQDPTRTATATVVIAVGTPVPPASATLQILGSFSSGVPVDNPIRYRLRVVRIPVDEVRWTFSASTNTIGVGNLNPFLGPSFSGPAVIDQFTNDYTATVGYPTIWRLARIGFVVTIGVRACLFFHGAPVLNFAGQADCLQLSTSLL